MANEFEFSSVKEFMTGYTVQNYDYNAQTMKIHVPRLFMDRSGGGSITTPMSVNTSIFKSRENITPAKTITNLPFIEVKVSQSFHGTFRALNYAGRESPHFPKGSVMRIYVPDCDLNQALVIPFI